MHAHPFSLDAAFGAPMPNPIVMFVCLVQLGGRLIEPCGFLGFVITLGRTIRCIT